MSSRPSAGAVTGRGLLALVTAAGVALAPALLAAPSQAPPAAALPDVPAAPADGGELGYPRQTRLPEPAVEAGDAALRPGLTAYHDVTRRLNAVMSLSDRVSAEVIGTSAGGRDIVLVTLTAPETPAQARAQASMRERITAQPARATTLRLDPA